LCFLAPLCLCGDILLFFFVVLSGLASLWRRFFFNSVLLAVGFYLNLITRIFNYLVTPKFISMAGIKAQKMQPGTSLEVDEYISRFPLEAQMRMNDIRKIIRQKAPEAIEHISYAMPGYRLFGKPLVYFAGYKNHIGFYATPQTHTAFADDLKQYKQGKGSVQFPMDRRFPLALIEKIVDYKVQLLSKGKQ
jgi:uncharacterized protein YdhG (YjbR/CyaY superfamily)